MKALVATLCDPRCHSLDDAIRQAKLAAQASPQFELDLARFLRIHCMDKSVDLPTVFQGLEVLGGIVEESRRVALFRPFLRSTDPRIASKCVLIAGRQSRSLTWLMGALNGTDDRVRANLIESLWRRQDPEVEEVLKSAIKDKHHRVAANAVYGLYLLGSDSWQEGLDHLFGSSNPEFRKSAVWVVRSVEGVDAAVRLKAVIRDADPDVRHAAFNALVFLRKSGARKETPVPETAGAGNQPG